MNKTSTLTDNTINLRNLIDDITNLPKDRYDEGYEKGFSDGKIDGKIDVSTLPKFAGKPTENADEFYYSVMSSNGIWSPAALIPFEGKVGTTYLMTAKMKCGTSDGIGVGFIYEDGTSVYSGRQSEKDYFFVSVSSDPKKRVVNLGIVYRTGGSGYLKDWMIETVLEDDENV
jgi:hypothetical protein